MTSDEPVRLELYVRSLLAEQARSQQDEVIERLNALKDDGAIDEFQVVIWGRQAPASPAQARTDAGVFVLNRVAVFSEWAAANGLSVDEHFEHRSVESSIVNESYQAVRFPVMTLAEYHGQDLAFVAPATEQDATHTVRERLAHIEREDQQAAGTDEFERLSSAYSEPPRQLTLAGRDGPHVTGV
ncbi:HTH domain-containing protein [Halorientalis brevis]|uniref:HTH domain-containing protein n=1 Tax=Halorientalis brevis TaxID=1126241 RepID=A0ABD6C728_9EURY|nr:HTH domain-containing protein [Halorientalis brevis]